MQIPVDDVRAVEKGGSAAAVARVAQKRRIQDEYSRRAEGEQCVLVEGTQYNPPRIYTA